MTGVDSPWKARGERWYPARVRTSIGEEQRLRRYGATTFALGAFAHELDGLCRPSRHLLKRLFPTSPPSSMATTPSAHPAHTSGLPFARLNWAGRTISLK
jgi:hypothetical protein